MGNLETDLQADYSNFCRERIADCRSKMRTLCLLPLLFSALLAERYSIDNDDNPSDLIPKENGGGLLPPEQLIRKSRSASNRATNTCGCGRTAASNRIVGGKEATPHSLPYQAFIESCFNSYCMVCGGTLLNKRYVLTAAHCIQDRGNVAFRVTVVLGEHNVRSNSEAIAPQVIRASLIKRDDYNSRTYNNDIAILKLSQDAVFNDNVIPACLPTNPNNMYVGQSAKVSGWGHTGARSSNVLKETDVTIVDKSDATCTPYGNPIPNSKMCAYKANTDSCQGDSGGPLALQENGKYTVVGVTSYGRGCARPGLAGVYARVTNYLDWINSNIADGWCDGATTQAPTTPRGGCVGEDTKYDWNECCTSSTPCGRGEGDCDMNQHCKAGLTCGENNCRTFNPSAHRYADCCE